MEIKNYGKVRIGATFARFVLEISNSEFKTEDETFAFFQSWIEEFELSSKQWEICGKKFAFFANSRKEFALIPVIIRRAEKAHLSLSTRMSDYDDVKEESFWKVLALSQMYYNI